jgi:formate-dependent nitrite reductase cytochrome c552 subunit
MLKLEEGLSGQTLRANSSAFTQQQELTRLTGDITDLKQRISDQITLIQELTWEAQETASAKKALHEMQEILRDWYAHRDLLIKLQAVEPQPV